MTPIGPDWQLLADLRARDTSRGDGSGTTLLTVPIRIVSEPNARGSWKRKAARVKAQRHAVAWAWTAAQWPRGTKPRAVRIVRLASRTLDDDNLSGGCKAIRDSIALLCGFNDRDPGVCWVYGQERAKVPSCRIEVTW